MLKKYLTMIIISTFLVGCAKKDPYILRNNELIRVEVIDSNYSHFFVLVKYSTNGKTSIEEVFSSEIHYLENEPK